MTNDEVRRRRLDQLARITEGGLTAIAKAVDTHPQYLDHILKRRKGAKKKDGTQAFVSMGDDLARRIEERHNLSPGWMDWPFTGVDFERYARLDEHQQAIVQGQMIAAIAEAEKLAPSPALAQVQRPAVSDKKVAAAYKKPATAKKAVQPAEHKDHVHHD